jgi:hypothetical protein
MRKRAASDAKPMREQHKTAQRGRDQVADEYAWMNFCSRIMRLPEIADKAAFLHRVGCSPIQTELKPSRKDRHLLRFNRARGGAAVTATNMP